MTHPRLVTFAILALAALAPARGQESADYRITESAFTAAGLPDGGAILSSSSFSISLATVDDGLSESALVGGGFRIDGGFVAEVCAGPNAGSCQCAAVGQGLVGWWPGDSNAEDISGNHNDGTLYTGASFVPGVVGPAFDLDGGDDYIGDIGTPSTFSFLQNTRVFTIDAWINLDNPNAAVQNAIIGNAHSRTHKGSLFFWHNLEADQTLRIELYNGSPVGALEYALHSESPPHVVSTSGWHHVAVVVDGTSVTFWVDGVSYPGTNTVVGALSSGDSMQLMAISYPGVLFRGSIDEVHVWNRALGADEIRAVRAGVTGVCRCADADRDGYATAGEADPFCAGIPDCNDAAPGVWKEPAVVTNVRATNHTTFIWDDQAPLVGPDVRYDVIRGFSYCAGSAIAGPSVVDEEIPAPDTLFWYLVRARNDCGVGDYGGGFVGACP